MANSRLKCKNKSCGEYHPREQIKAHPAGFCSDPCFAASNLARMEAKWAKDKARQARDKKAREKAFNAETRRRKQVIKKTCLKTRKAAAKKACHTYIRARDKGRPCICCGRPLGDKYDAGHWLESGNNPKTRYHEDNIHAQSVYCNQYKGGDSDDYEGRLRIKIGDDRVEYLKENKGGTMKRTAEDYIEIEQHYKNKLKELENN